MDKITEACRHLITARRMGVLRLAFVATPLALLGVLGLFAAPALAAPEVPETTEATAVTATSATLNGVLNPTKKGEAGTYYFRYGPATRPCEGAPDETPPGHDAGEQGEVVTATVSNLVPATKYTFCLVAANSEGYELETGPEKFFTTPPGAPTVSAQAVIQAGANTASVSAEIDPSGLSTSYHVEYVSAAQFAAHGWAEATHVPATDAVLPAASTPVAVTESLGGLTPTTAYRFRFIATNSVGGGAGVESAFTTILAGGAASALPDGRVYELVSNSGGVGEPYEPNTLITFNNGAGVLESEFPFQVAENGNRVAYIGEPAYEGGVGDVSPGLGNEWLAERTATGWNTEDITPSSHNASADNPYQAFSPSLDTGIVEVTEGSLSSLPAGCTALYLRATSTHSFSPLLPESNSLESCGHPLVAGASEDDQQVIFQSEAALTPEATKALPAPGRHQYATPGDREGCMFGCNLYDFTGGRLHLVNVLEGRPTSSANFGGYSGNGEYDLANFRNAISRTGSRIFWTDTQEGPDMGHIYVLEDGTRNVPVSAGAAEYWTSTPDGLYAYYTEAGALWRFNTASNIAERLTTDEAAVQGVVGVNETGEDGSYLYFVADGGMAPGSSFRTCVSTLEQGAIVEREFNEGHITEAEEKVRQNMLDTEENEEQAGETPAHTGCNLYAVHDDTFSLVSVVPPADNRFRTGGVGATVSGSVWSPYPGERVANISPDGRHLVFESHAALTGYNVRNERSAPEDRPVEVFVYSAEDQELACASCNPDGSAPVFENQDLTELPVGGLNEAHAKQWMSDDGNRVFFETAQPLVPQDKNGTLDVYEWERESTGTCTAQSPARQDHGCVFLLSGGESPYPSFLVEADATGENVFFEHTGSLGGLEAPDQNELYDARVGGGFPQGSLACTGTGCQGVPPAAPIFATPPSATFTGPGNPPALAPPKTVVKSLTRAQKLAKALKACAKVRNKLKRTTCQAQARKKYGAKIKTKHKPAGNRRGAKS